MKKILTAIFFCLMIAAMWGYVFANNATKLWTNNTNYTDTSAVYIVDGNFVNSVSNIKPADIFGVSILKDSLATALYGKRAKNGAVVITTKPQAIKDYQEKLSNFSKKYLKYLEKKGDDSKLLYVINNTMLQVGTNHSIRELYELDPANIDKVIFRKDRRFKNDATVIIITTGN